jgi:hypothetical protein
MSAQPRILTLLPHEYSICRFSSTASLWSWIEPGAAGDDFISVTRTRDELSVACTTRRVPGDVKHRSDGWRCTRVEGPLDFALTGVLASIAAPLAEAKISVFAIATFDTDYVLVRAADLDRAIEALERAGHRVQ